MAEVGKFDGGKSSPPHLSESQSLRGLAGVSDDWGVIAVTDANFGRYQITAEELNRAMSRDPKVFAALICIGESAEVPW